VYTDKKMGFFDENNEDPFDEIVKQFFGENNVRRGASHKNKIIENEEDERMIDFVEDENNAYVIFELPGYRKEDIRVVVEDGEIEVIARRKTGESVPSYLANRLNNGIELKKPLPKHLKKKKFSWDLNNGVLEVVFTK
jgi:HSP20 family molecular chaperone IbpA